MGGSHIDLKTSVSQLATHRDYPLFQKDQQATTYQNFNKFKTESEAGRQRSPELDAPQNETKQER